MRAVITPDDLKRGDLVAPGWYPGEISNYEEATTKDNKEKGTKSDGSTNCIFEFRADAGPVLKRYINEKALGFGKDLYAAMNLPKNEAGGYDVSTELFEKAKGVRIEVYIKRGVNAQNGKEFNEWSDTRASR